MIVSSPVEALWGFVNERLGIPWSSDFRAIGSVKNSCLGAVAGYNAFVGRTCVMHGAIDDPSAMSRTFVKAIFKYPFEDCKLTHMTAMVDSANLKSLDFVKRCGFREVHRFEDAGLEGRDMILFQLLRSECRFLRDKHGQEERPAATARLRGAVRAAGRSVEGEHRIPDSCQPA